MARKKSNRARRIKWYLIAATLLALVEYYYIFRAGLLNDRLRTTIVTSANARLLGRLEIGGFEGDLFDRFTITDLQLFEPDGALALAIGSAEAEWVKNDGPRPVLEITADNLYVRAVKRDGLWNFRRLRKPRLPRLQPTNLPAAEIRVLVRNSRVELSWSPEQLIEARVPVARAELILGGPKIQYSITEFSAAVASPVVGVNGFLGRGAAVSTVEGWRYLLDSGQLITASSSITISNAAYDPPTKELEAEFPAFTIAPDTLALFWAKHPLVIPLTGQATVSGKTSDLAVTAVVDSSAGALTAQGNIRDRGRQGDLTGGLTDFSLGDFVDKKYGLTGLTGGFHLAYYYAITDEKRERRAEVELDLSKFTYPGFNSLPLSAEVKLENDDFTGSLLSEAPGIRLAANFRGALSGRRPIALEAVARRVNPVAVRPGLPEGLVSGKLKLSGEGTGLESFSGRAELAVSATRIAALEIDRGDFTGRIGGGKIMFDRAEVVARGAVVQGQGWVKVTDKSYPFNFDVNAEVNSADDVAKLLGDKVKMDQLSGVFVVKGDKNRWSADGSAVALGFKASVLTVESVDAKVNLSGRGGSSFSGQVSVLGKNAGLPSARYNDFSIPSFDLLGEATIVPSKPSAPVIDFDLHTPSLEGEFGIKTTGRFDAGRGSGSWALDLAELVLRVRARTYTLKNQGRIVARTGGTWIEPLTLERGEESLSVSGAAGSRTVDLALHAEKFDLGPWTSVLLPGDSVLGVVTGDIKIQGPSGAPELVADLTTSRPVYHGTRFERLTTTLTVRDGRAEFNAEAVSDDAGVVAARGTLPTVFSVVPWRFKVQPDQPMEITIDAPDVPARFLESLLPWISRAQGRLSVLTDIRGTYRSPEWNGKASLASISFTVPGWGLEIKDLSGDAAIVKNLVTIPRMVVRSGDGEATLTGTLTLAKFTVAGMELDLTATNFQAMNSPEIRATLSTQMKITGNFNRPRVRGKVQFIDLTYRPPLLLQYQGTSWETEDQTIAVVGENPELAVRSPLLDRTDLDLIISIPNTGKLKSAELNVRFGGDLDLKKPPGAFYLIIGNLTTREGWITFQGKPFKVERGTFEFPAIPVIDPDLDILASYRVPDYKTYLKIGGRLSAPTLEIYSEPPLDPADVLAVILFGKPAGGLAEGQRNALALAGANILAGYAAAELAQSLQETLHIDAIILQPGESAETSGVGFETYLTDRLYLYYFHRFGEEAAEEFRLRYELFKYFSIEAGQDDKGQGGLDLLFHYLFGKPDQTDEPPGPADGGTGG